MYSNTVEISIINKKCKYIAMTPADIISSNAIQEQEYFLINNGYDGTYGKRSSSSYPKEFYTDWFQMGTEDSTYDLSVTFKVVDSSGKVLENPGTYIERKTSNDLKAYDDNRNLVVALCFKPTNSLNQDIKYILIDIDSGDQTQYYYMGMYTCQIANCTTKASGETDFNCYIDKLPNNVSDNDTGALNANKTYTLGDDNYYYSYYYYSYYYQINYIYNNKKWVKAQVSQNKYIVDSVDSDYSTPGNNGKYYNAGTWTKLAKKSAENS